MMQSLSAAMVARMDAEEALFKSYGSNFGGAPFFFGGGDRRPAHSRPTTLHNNVLQILHTSIEDILSSNVRAQFSPSQRLEGGGGGILLTPSRGARSIT